MDKKQLEMLHKNSEELFSASLLLERESKEQLLLYFASELIEISIEIMEERNNG